MKAKRPPVGETRWKTTAEVAAMEHRHRSRKFQRCTSTKNTKHVALVKPKKRVNTPLSSSNERNTLQTYQRQQQLRRKFLNQQIEAYVPTKTDTKKMDG